MTPQEKLELLLDLIADELIVSEFVNTTNVEDNQKFILNGQLQRGGGEGVLALFQKDIKANQEDLNQTTIINEGTEDEQVIPKLQEIANRITDFNTLFISINSGENGISIELSNGGLASSELITDLIIQGGEFSNTSQFISLKQQKSNIDIDKAEEFLDTNIFELLPTGDTRQSRIVRFFQELNALIPTDLPNFDTDNNGVVDRAQDGTWDGATEYSQDNSISYAQDNPEESNIDEENAAFHRLKDTANDTNSSLTIEDIYNTIEPYLTDILEDPITPQDERPEYVNQSSGYLKFRNLNQGIVIRNTNKDFIEGLNPSNPTYLNTDGTGGFTITMWVRFLDKASEGTLFNFGNPTGVNTPFGFKLETYILNKDDSNPHTNHETWGTGADFIIDRDSSYPLIYENSNTARFVRLVVNDNGTLRDSHVGVGGATKNNNIPDMDGLGNDEFRLLQTTFIPENFQEWYFICASFNPIVDEDNSFGLTGPNGEVYNENTTFWLNHIEPISGESIFNSGLGNKCKVEIISKTDLLRSKGFKV
tara:strand:- start:9343 stop:10950 length:1608 start_codon:yes stop_codon:yes gene_type:complete